MLSYTFMLKVSSTKNRAQILIQQQIPRESITFTPNQYERSWGSLQKQEKKALSEWVDSDFSISLAKYKESTSSSKFYWAKRLNYKKCSEKKKRKRNELRTLDDENEWICFVANLPGIHTK